MLNQSKFLSVAALAAASLFAAASSAGAQDPVQRTQDAPRQCAVTVDRSAESGLFSVARQELDNGDCVCAITTGPDGQAASIEEQVANLVRERVCQDAPAVSMQSGGGGGGALLAGAAGLAGLAGLIAVVSDGNNAPVSP